MSTPSTPTHFNGQYRYESSGATELPVTPQPLLKRKTTNELTPTAPKKPMREYSTLGMDNSMGLIRRTVGGKQIPLENAVDHPTEDGEEENFVDASEELEGGAQDVQRTVQEVPDNDDDDDLFSKIQPKFPAARDDDEDGSDQEAEDGSEAETTPRIVECDCAGGKHNKSCHATRSVSTPAGSQSQTIKKEQSPSSDAVQITGSKVKTPARPKLPEESDLEKDYSKDLARFRKWHERMKLLIPRLHLPEHRYWIGVLPVGRKPRNATTEKHMTWMKGNRMTTISTVWHKIAELHMIEDFVLLLGNEKLKLTDRAEELNYFNDKFVCLRAVDKNDPQAKGKPTSEGLVPQVVDLIDDD
ncbi:hypothetical protein Tdes44962_MAKER04159 [Teratosphaeria destructans]|uniref:Uncharacterized protein n=1 Tax=Teratosphaeria destructans TaxID=418781 RepID=A0A9W7W072_9PEZI|nr:hypothetical protein Tdes44962_MAKER04159 [Teratosphaeria destructans]